MSKWCSVNGRVEMIDPSMADLAFCTIWEFFGESSPVGENRGRCGCWSGSGCSDVLL